MVSKNGTGTNDLSVKLNQLEDKVIKLTAQIKENKQTITELKLTIAQRDIQISELEAKLGYAQQSLIEKAAQKIQECRTQIKSGLDERLVNPTVSQIQQQLKTAQAFVDETKTLILAKKAQLDSNILIAKDKVLQSPGQAKSYIEKSLVSPAQMLFTKALDNVNQQIKATHETVADKVLYPGKVMLDDMFDTVQALPGKTIAFLETQVIEPLGKAKQKATEVQATAIPNSFAAIEKTTSRIIDVIKQAQFEIGSQIKKSPFWNGKDRLGASY